MRKIEPDGIDNIIVLIKHNNKFQYFVSEKELWILDELMVIDAFKKKGYEVPLSEKDLRHGYRVLSEKNIAAFLGKIQDLAVDMQELKEFYEVYSELEEDVQYVAKPIFYIDFDTCTFTSFFIEPGSYEEYLPDGWKGNLRMNEQDEYVPEEMKYWG